MSKSIPTKAEVKQQLFIALDHGRSSTQFFHHEEREQFTVAHLEHRDYERFFILGAYYSPYEISEAADAIIRWYMTY